jgi:hypothetical protein
MSAGAPGRVAVLRLHTDADGLVWYGDDGQLAVNSFLPAQDFLRSDVLGFPLSSAACIRLLGTWANAPLVVHVQQLRASQPEMYRQQRVQLAAPALVPTAALRDDPVAVLQHLWQPTYSSRCPGMWHDMSNLDFCTYAMIQQLAGSVSVPEIVRRIVVYHPAWPALSFVPGLDVDAGCRLLCDIVDPRWYKHPTHPGRLGRLHAHLGLVPANMRAYLGDGPPGRHFDRAVRVVQTWYGGQGSSPTGFLGRALAAGRCGQDVCPDGLLRGCRRLADLVAIVWLLEVQPRHPEAHFDPLRFFGDREEADRFLSHYRAQKRI